MKFPLPERPFDRLQLSPERLQRLHALANDVVLANLAEFHDFVNVHNRALPRERYKPIKSQDKITIYKEAKHRDERIFGPHGRPLQHASPLLPKLVAAGTIRGKMDDMLLGTAVRDAVSVMTKTSYVDDEVVDCEVRELLGSTVEDPFRYMAARWIAKAHPTGLNAVVAPRDMILVQSSGLMEGIGYHMLHSIDDIVPEVGSFESKYGILRAKLSSMVMFRQLTPDTIECYAVNYVQPNGLAPEAVTIKSTAASMGGVWKSLDCAYNMKLSWILSNKEAYMGSTRATLAHYHGDKCELCHKKSTLTGSMGDCSLCDARVCSRCRVTKKLSKVNRRLEIQIEKHDFCKTCLFRAVNEDAFRIASEMNVGVPITPWVTPKGSLNRLGLESSDALSDSYSSLSSLTSQGSNKDLSSKKDFSSSYSSYFNSSSARNSPPASSSVPDVLKFDASKLLRPSVQKASMPSSSVTELDSDDEGFFDLDAGCIDEEEEAAERERYQAFLAQEHERRKRELDEEYRMQLQQLAQPPSQSHDLTTYSRPDLRQPNVTPASSHYASLYEQMRSLQLTAERTFEMTARANEWRQSHVPVYNNNTR